MDKDTEDLSLVYWGDYKEALKWLFYKLTQSRTLFDDELHHLGTRLFGNSEFSNSKTFGSQRGEVRILRTFFGDLNIANCKYVKEYDMKDAIIDTRYNNFLF